MLLDTSTFFSRFALFEWTLAVKSEGFYRGQELTHNVKSLKDFVCVGQYELRVARFYNVQVMTTQDKHDYQARINSDCYFCVIRSYYLGYLQ